MSKHFYKLNGYNDPNLKHTYAASLPEELHDEMQRLIQAMQQKVTDMSLGEIHQIALKALNKLCDQRILVREMLKDNQPFKAACKKPHL